MCNITSYKNMGGATMSIFEKYRVMIIAKETKVEFYNLDDLKLLETIHINNVSGFSIDHETDRIFCFTTQNQILMVTMDTFEYECSLLNAFADVFSDGEYFEIGEISLIKDEILLVSDLTYHRVAIYDLANKRCEKLLAIDTDEKDMAGMIYNPTEKTVTMLEEVFCDVPLEYKCFDERFWQTVNSDILQQELKINLLRKKENVMYCNPSPKECITYHKEGGLFRKKHYSLIYSNYEKGISEQAELNCKLDVLYMHNLFNHIHYQNGITALYFENGVAICRISGDKFDILDSILVDNIADLKGYDNGNKIAILTWDNLIIADIQS